MFRIPGYVAALLVPATVLAASLADISNRDAVNGLKEALIRGGHAAVARLGVENGFFRNDRVKIPLPPSLRRVEAVMRSIGMDRHADDLVLRMNRAAEAAVPEAKTLLADAVKKMSVQDAKGILTGGDDAATQYFKRMTWRISSSDSPRPTIRPDLVGMSGWRALKSARSSSECG